MNKLKDIKRNLTIKGPSLGTMPLIDDGGDFCIIENGKIIAETFRRVGVNDYVDAEANAKLMAAAPDLLEALKSIVNMGNEDSPYVWDLALKAISKAEN